MSNLGEANSNIQQDIDLIAQIDVIPTILEVIRKATNMGFATIARVTEKKWVACAVSDDINFGLLPGDELVLETTICHEIRQSNTLVVIGCEGPWWQLKGQLVRRGNLFYPIAFGDFSKQRNVANPAVSMLLKPFTG